LLVINSVTEHDARCVQYQDCKCPTGKVHEQL